MPARLRECTCGHLGDRHREDGSCAAKDCGCRKFVRPKVQYAAEAPHVHHVRRRFNRTGLERT